METDLPITPEQAQAVQRNFLQVQESIAQAARRSGRSAERVRLVVVTKTQPVAVITAAITAGACVFGENYAEQAQPKITALRPQFPQVEWHMIGHIQSRKAGLVVEHFDLVHSLDSLKLAERLDRLAGEAQRKLPVLIELNIGGEASKTGWSVDMVAQEQAWLAELEQVVAHPNLQVRGLMAMPPLWEDPEQTRPYFRKMLALQAELANRFPNVDWTELSMGTSSDYQVAVEEGATMVRVGQAILGPRPPRPSAGTDTH